MTVFGLELGLGYLGFNGLLVTGVSRNFNAIDENACLKQLRVSICCLYLPEVHRSVFPVSFDSTSLQTHTLTHSDVAVRSKGAVAVLTAPMATNDVSYSFFASTSSRIRRGLCVSNSENSGSRPNKL